MRLLLTQMQSLRHGCRHESVNELPLLHHLRISKSEHLIPLKLQPRVVEIVGVAFCAGVRAAVDLNDEAVTDEEIDAVTVQPDLRADGSSEKPESCFEQCFEPGIRVRRAHLEE